MKIKHLLFGERSITKVAALFASKSVAEAAAQQVKQTAGLDDPQVYLVGPPDVAVLNSPAFSRKLEPEQAGIWRTIIRAHVITGSAGIVLGVLIYLGFLLAGSVPVNSSPGLSLMVAVFFGAVVGLLLGGFLTARPDHAWVTTTVRSAIRSGRWALVIHPLTQHQLELVMRELHTRSDRVVRSL